jgi:imidazoleglycerol-phosphate dehydratase/histidinol-phosphatase
LNIKATGDNEHHKVESIFKAFAKAIKMAIRRDPDKMVLPTTKGKL